MHSRQSNSAALKPAAVLAALLLNACSFLGLDPKETKESELAKHRRIWESRGIVTYQYLYQLQCYCPAEYTTPMLVTVHGGTVSSAVYAHNGNPVGPSIQQQAPTVGELFDIVQEAIDEGAYQLTVQYDPTLGYPTSIGIDHRVNIADDEVTYTASALLQLPGGMNNTR